MRVVAVAPAHAVGIQIHRDVLHAVKVNAELVLLPFEPVRVICVSEADVVLVIYLNALDELIAAVGVVGSPVQRAVKLGILFVTAYELHYIDLAALRPGAVDAHHPERGPDPVAGRQLSAHLDLAVGHVEMALCRQISARHRETAVILFSRDDHKVAVADVDVVGVVSEEHGLCVAAVVRVVYVPLAAIDRVAVELVPDLLDDRRLQRIAGVIEIHGRGRRERYFEAV